MSSNLVVRNSRLPDWLWCMQTKNNDEKRMNTKTVTRFPKWNTDIKLLSQSWLCTRYRVYYNFQWSRQANQQKHTSMQWKSTHWQAIPPQSTQTQQTRGYRHTTNTSGLFLSRDTGIGFSFRNIVANLGSFAKVPVPVGSIIPWAYQGIIDRTGMGTGEIFSRMFVIAKKLKSCLPLL